MGTVIDAQLEKRGCVLPENMVVMRRSTAEQVLQVKKDKMGVGRMLFGNEKRCYEKYVAHNRLPKKDEEFFAAVEGLLFQMDWEGMRELVKGASG
ncbi:MAG: hypothetical protein IJT34_04150 [Butyrivibrio sp.]|nr:hypothetical protein [Butyrivibrio sp.]